MTVLVSQFYRITLLQCWYLSVIRLKDYSVTGTVGSCLRPMLVLQDFSVTGSQRSSENVWKEFYYSYSISRRSQLDRRVSSCMGPIAYYSGVFHDVFMVVEFWNENAFILLCNLYRKELEV